MLTPIIQATALLALYESESLVIIDASNGQRAKANYQEKHLLGALYVDLNSQLADIKEDLSMGGRHPLPKIENFKTTLAQLGIDAKSHVVIYDDKNGSNAAARFWWMLKSIGHEKVQVLNGGFKAAEEMNFPVSSNEERVKQVDPYQIDNWRLPIALMEEVERVAQNEKYRVIDVRDADRFNGKTEPIDLIAGHIPGAINVPFTENMDENGLFLSSNELKEKYQQVFDLVGHENVIVHCGSGVSACHTLLAIAYAGLTIPKLYVGSWSEWSRNHN